MKNRHCPAFRTCRDDCTDCEHSIRYNRLHGKVKRQKAKIDNLEKRLEEEKHALFEQQAYTAKLQAEIERLEGESSETFHKWEILAERTKDRYAELYEEAKGVVRAEAIKEFAEKIKGIDLYQCIEEYYKNAELCYDVRRDWFCEYIDFLVKEMTEDKDGNL